MTRVATPGSLDDTVDNILVRLVTTSTAAIAALKSQLASVEIPNTEAARLDEQVAMRRAYEDGDAPERIEELL